MAFGSYLSILLILIHHPSAQPPIQSATLTVTQTVNNYAQVDTNNVGYADAVHGWNVNVQTITGWHWHISFHNDSWKFQSNEISTLTLKIYSTSQFSADDREMFVVFSQNDTDYVTSLTQLDNNTPNSIYPQCGAEFADGDIDWKLNRNNGNPRKQRLMNNGWGNQEVYLEPQNNASLCCENSSPMIFKFINNPIEKWSQFIYTNSMDQGWRPKCKYIQIWSSDEYMDIFIMGNDIGEDLNIIKFELFMQDEQQLLPTVSPGTYICTGANCIQ